MSTAGKILLIIGGVLILVAIIAMVLGTVVFSEIEDDLTDPEDEKVASGQGVFTATLTSGKTYQIWSESDELIDVEVTDPSGNAVRVDEAIIALRDDWILEGEFTANSDGIFTVNLTDISGDVITDKCLVTNEIDIESEDEEAVGGFVAGCFGWTAGLCLGGIGVILLIIGIIVAIVKKDKPKQQDQVPPGYPQQQNPPPPQTQ